MVFEQEKFLLQEYGHEVISYERSNDELEQRKALPRILGVVQAVWSRETYSEFSELLKRTSPDVVHVHNTFLRISPSIFQACHDARIPAVHTVHNYRLLCPGTNLFRDGAPCEKCVGGNLLHGIARGCYRSSRVATAVAASTVAYNRRRGTWTNAVSHYIAPTRFLKNKLVAAGLEADRITVKPHFVNHDPGVMTGRRDYAIFVGRLSPEKGLVALLSAWEQLPHIQLLIVGDGPQRPELEAISRQKKLNVSFEGHLPRATVLDKLRSARLLVFPSLAYESFGMGIIEAYACGVPVIASNHGAMQELVDHGNTGLLFEPGDADSLSASVRLLWTDRDLLKRTGHNARSEYERKYTPAANYEALMTIYERELAVATSNAAWLQKGARIYPCRSETGVASGFTAAKKCGDGSI